MHACYNSRLSPPLFSEIMDSHTQTWDQHVSHREDPSQQCGSGLNKDTQCPVCLQTSTFPVKTNCGHIFCAPCLISYWKHGSWLDAINCPLCRQKVSVMCRLFSESRSNHQEREMLKHIQDYNKRYSGAPRQMMDYLCDAPLFLLLVMRGLGNIGGLVWLFLLRVALCGFGAAMSLASPLEAVPDPFGGVLGILDDLVVVFLVLICIININQQMAPERAAGTRTVTQGVLTDTL
ncbi:E3 ubiquitin-protein ligase RNF170 [Chanos chanos]|uniref:E3 ubiquitin-protein ligase RNF170 n=1 Tax=Chanos chanos TaxID=29144 RepID=A0A6J2V8Y9_CHACN|nr:E3 ubiquitin-protein ligase RNF170-like [Chanos chanos]